MPGKAVTVRVESVRRDLTGTSDVIVTSAVGRRIDKNGVVYIAYVEPAESGLEGTKTLLKWDGTRLCLSRSGSVKQELVFAEDETTTSDYQTEFLQIGLIVQTASIRAFVDEWLLDIAIEYLMIIGEQEQGLTKLRILVGED